MRLTHCCRRGGKIAVDDFKDCLHRLHIDMTKDQLNALLKKLGADRGMVDWRNFMRFFQKAPS